jgi:peroxiredoxin
MTIQVGDRLPSVKLYIMTEKGPRAVDSDDLFTGKKVVLFALPGAFTPTCSAAHLPGYVVHADEIKAKEVDRIICLAVNDAFVMDAWGKAQNVENRVFMVADGNGDFTRAVGLEMDGNGFGMGLRSQRYAMIIEDGRLTALNIDPPGTFEVSGAENILQQLESAKK